MEPQEKRADFLAVNNLSIRYYNTQFPIVENLSFSISEREIVCLQGASGRGKSTVVWALMEMLPEYQAVADGEIILARKKLIYNWSNPPENKRVFRWSEIALVPQSSMNSFNPAFTIRQTLAETMKAEGIVFKKQDSERALKNLMEKVKLPFSVLDAYPHQLSGGMKQRAAIALAILFQPQLLILDEATTGLDLLTEAEVLKTILELKRHKPMTILFISHDRRLAEGFCDRMVSL